MSDGEGDFPPNSEPVWRDAPPASVAAESASFPPQLTEAEQAWMPEWHAICYAAAAGRGSGEIARDLGYSQSRVSVVLHMPAVQERIARIRQADHEKFGRRLADAAPRVLDYYLDVAFGKEKGDPHRLRASEWVMEKHDGKAVQKVQNDGGNTALDLIRALKDLRTQNTLPPAPKTDSGIIDVTPAPEADHLDSWITQHIKPEGKA